MKKGYRNPIGFRRWVKVAKNQKLLYTHGMGTWKSKNRHKYLLQYHIICKIVNLMKSYTTYHIWKRYPQYLRKQFWKAHTFWTDGYLACSVGNVSEEMLKRYIENQGWERG